MGIYRGTQHGRSGVTPNITTVRNEHGVSPIPSVPAQHCSCNHRCMCIPVQARGRAVNTSNDRSAGWYMAAFDRNGKYVGLYMPEDFAEGDLPTFRVLRLALAAVIVEALS